MSDLMLYDSQTAFQGGMQAGVDPGLVADHQYARGINVICREGVLDVRPSFDKLNLDTAELASSAQDYTDALADYNAAVAQLTALEAIETTKQTDYDNAVATRDAAIAAARANAIIQGIESHYSLTLGELNIDEFLKRTAGRNGVNTGVLDRGVTTPLRLTPGASIDSPVYVRKDPTLYPDVTFTDEELHTLLFDIEYFFRITDIGSDIYDEKIIYFHDNATIVTADAADEALLQSSITAWNLVIQVDTDNETAVTELSELTTAQADVVAQEAVVAQKLAILESTIDFQDVFNTGKFQGAEIYKTNNRNYIVQVINGHVFMTNLLNNKVTAITTATTKLNELVDRCYFVQAENYMIIQDGISQPKIMEGASIRDADSSIPEIPRGTNMAYGHGRIAIQVSPSHFVMSDIYLAYDPENVLKMTEFNFLNEGGGFTVSGRLGNIISLQLAKVADTSTGDGPLLAICENGFASYSINNPRAQWNDIDIAKIQLFGTGLVGNTALCHISEDILYRSHEGIRSYQVGQREATQGYKYTELSKEVEPYVQNDMQYNGKFLAMEFFDKRMLSLTTPRGMKARTTGYQEVQDDYDTKKAAALLVDASLTDHTVYADYVARLDYIIANATEWTPKAKIDGGIYTNWLHFDATNKGYVKLMPDDTDVPASFTVHMDFIYDGTDGDAASQIACHVGTFQDGGWHFGVNYSGGHVLTFQTNSNPTDASSSAINSIALTPGNRHRITASYDGPTKTMKLLVDGEVLQTTIATHAMAVDSVVTMKAQLFKGHQGGWTAHCFGKLHKFLYLNVSSSDTDLADIHDLYKPFPTENIIYDIEARGVKTDGITDDSGTYSPEVIMTAGSETYDESEDWIWYREIISTAQTLPAPDNNTCRIQKIIDAADPTTPDLSGYVSDAATVKAYYEAYLALTATYIDDTFFKGIIAFDFSLAGYTKSTQDSQYSRVTTGSYDGIWTGINPTALMVSIKDGLKRCFATAKSPTGENIIYEITRRMDGYDNLNSKAIECILDTRSMPYKAEQTYVPAPFVWKKLEDLTLWVTGISKDVSIEIQTSSDVLDSFAKVGELLLKTITSTSDDPREIGAPQSRAMIPLYDMPFESDPTTKEKIRLGNEFMFRLIWSGKVRLRRLFTAARKLEQDRQTNIETEAIAYPIDTFDEYRYSSE